MTTKMKGICKGFKYISHFFVVKEHEMEIGYPTDVKHVAHIGWDCPGSSPSWMNEFKPGPDFSVPTTGNISQPREPNRVAVSPWSSQDFEQPIGHPPVTQVFKDRPPTDLPKAPRKQKRKKIKSTSSPKASPSSRSSRTAKFKAKQAEADAVVNL